MHLAWRHSGRNRPLDFPQQRAPLRRNSIVMDLMLKSESQNGLRGWGQTPSKRRGLARLYILGGPEERVTEAIALGDGQECRDRCSTLRAGRINTR